MIWEEIDKILFSCYFIRNK